MDTTPDLKPCDLIKMKHPDFDYNSFISRAKSEIKYIYQHLQNKDFDYIKSNYNDKIYEKFSNNLTLFRINPDIDSMTVQASKITSFIKNLDLINLELSVVFYDNTINNTNTIMQKDMYWNDIWILTYKRIENTNILEKKCNNCGATLTYNKYTKIFKCEYCKNEFYSDIFQKNWELHDINIK